MMKTLTHGVDEFQTYTYLVCQPFHEEDDNNSSGDYLSNTNWRSNQI